MSTLSVATVSSVATIKSSSGGVPDVQNSSGTEVGFFIRAWASFNGSSFSLLKSGGVSSMSDEGEGQYRVNFTTAFADTNYCMVEGCSNTDTSPRMVTQVNKTTSLYEFKTRSDSNALNDCQFGQIAFIDT